MHDLVIRGGTIVDGSGAARVVGDVAIDGNRLAQVGGKAGAARREIDAGGAIVTPGWVDVHTHYDGQVTWDPYLTPSSWHGACATDWRASRSWRRCTWTSASRRRWGSRPCPT